MKSVLSWCILFRCTLVWANVDFLVNFCKSVFPIFPYKRELFFSVRHFEIYYFPKENIIQKKIKYSCVLKCELCVSLHKWWLDKKIWPGYSLTLFSVFCYTMPKYEVLSLIRGNFSILRILYKTWFAAAQMIWPISATRSQFAGLILKFQS